MANFPATAAPTARFATARSSSYYRRPQRLKHSSELPELCELGCLRRHHRLRTRSAMGGPQSYSCLNAQPTFLSVRCAYKDDEIGSFHSKSRQASRLVFTELARVTSASSTEDRKSSLCYTHLANPSRPGRCLSTSLALRTTYFPTTNHIATHETIFRDMVLRRMESCERKCAHMPTRTFCKI